MNCAALLERLPPVWRLDRAESTRAQPEIPPRRGRDLIVNHDGRGWWDPLSEAKGDIFNLVQHLEPGLTFLEARRMLRDFVGIAPAFPGASGRGGPGAPAPRHRRTMGASQPLSRGRRPGASSRTARNAGLILTAARAADAVREGPRGSAWFAHRDDAGE